MTKPAKRLRHIALIAISSAIDCAFWALRDKWVNTPVYRLLGNSVRETVPADAGALGFSLEPDVRLDRYLSHSS
jgi:L-alanine-DL-glutamate epimerase-like enolase superfamily enzyme